MTKTGAIAHDGEGGQLIIKIRLIERHGIRKPLQEEAHAVVATWSLEDNDRRRRVRLKRSTERVLDGRVNCLCRLSSG